MAATIYEIRPRRVTNDGVTRIYHIEDAPNESDVATAIGTLPDTVAGFPFSGYTAEEIEDCENHDEYFATVNWGNANTPDAELTAGTSGYRFSFQAPSAHIKQSLATIAAYADTAYWAPLGAPDFKGAINVSGFGTPDMTVEGIDLQPPPEVFTIPYADVDAVIDSTYQALVRSLCGKVNSDTFYGNAAGEIMLVRVDGQRQNGLWNIEFGFGYIPNATNIPVGDNITVSAKDGMDLLWAYYSPTKATGGIITIPTAAYVERVWQRADLNNLSLP